jgi:Arc/MetJ-type ribon-helix-helix transcriptional regulator
MVNVRQKKITLSLNRQVVEEMQRLVREGRAPSQSAFVELALRGKILREKRSRRRRALLTASKDPLYLADLAEVERAFTGADAEASRFIR